ncbi:hypothetical protein [Pseudonocardia acaciae]|uniref:hypothetical protein n=1 Tax=Pseudonocardia acaciae TaxID=551276 RepID=UPI000491892F|nr:hypothetical protein [Pseudonocardia acaciae]
MNDQRAKPWADVIPEHDLASFGRGFDRQDRPLAAGARPAVVVVDMARAFVDSTYPMGWSATGYPGEPTRDGSSRWYTAKYPVRALDRLEPACAHDARQRGQAGKVLLVAPGVELVLDRVVDVHSDEVEGVRVRRGDRASYSRTDALFPTILLDHGDR